MLLSHILFQNFGCIFCSLTFLFDGHPYSANILWTSKDFANGNAADAGRTETPSQIGRHSNSKMFIGK